MARFIWFSTTRERILANHLHFSCESCVVQFTVILYWKKHFKFKLFFYFSFKSNISTNAKGNYFFLSVLDSKSNFRFIKNLYEALLLHFSNSTLFNLLLTISIKNEKSEKQTHITCHHATHKKGVTETENDD